jgi:LPXTG-site transpeptidase (sortase) family protein
VSRRKTWPAILLLGGLLVMAIGAFLLLQRHSAPAPEGRIVTASPVPLISDFPSAAPAPSATPVDGERIQVPALHIDLPVVAGDGYNAPLYKAATYPTLKLPGQGGRSFIYAHARAGMFDPLFNAQVGEEVDILRPDAPTLKYRITEYYRRWPISDLRWLQPADHEELILSTCTTYNYNDPRIVAVAEPIQ